MHLGLDLLFQHDLAAFQDFLDVRAQFPRLRIDDGEFFLDPEREPMIPELGIHAAELSKAPSKKALCHHPVERTRGTCASSTPSCRRVDTTLNPQEPSSPPLPARTYPSSDYRDQARVHAPCE